MQVSLLLLPLVRCLISVPRPHYQIFRLVFAVELRVLVFISDNILLPKLLMKSLILASSVNEWKSAQPV